MNPITLYKNISKLRSILRLVTTNTSGYVINSSDTVIAPITFKSAVKVALVEPAATFTSVTPSDGGSGTIALTSAGAHGLTTAVAVGASIYISAGTGWTAGFYPITNIAVDTSGTVFKVTGTYDVGMGSPTIALANTAVTLRSVALPALSANSSVSWDVLFGVSPDASAGTATARVLVDAQTINSGGITTTNKLLRWISRLTNRGATDSQISSWLTANTSSNGMATTAAQTFSIDTSTSKNVIFQAQPSAANTVVSLEAYLIEVII